MNNTEKASAAVDYLKKSAEKIETKEAVSLGVDCEAAVDGEANIYELCKKAYSNAYEKNQASKAGYLLSALIVEKYGHEYGDNPVIKPGDELKIDKNCATLTRNGVEVYYIPFSLAMGTPSAPLKERDELSSDVENDDRLPISPENLDEIATTPEGRKRLRLFALDSEGRFKFSKSQPDFYNAFKIHHFYQGEPIWVNGQATEYTNGSEGLTYYSSGNTSRRIRVFHGTKISENPPSAPEKISRKFSTSPVADVLERIYVESDPHGRKLLENSRYTGESLDETSLRGLEAQLEGNGFLSRLEQFGWAGEKPALIVDGKTQSMYLLYKADGGGIDRARRYTISTGANGVRNGGDGSHSTLPGMAKLSVEYGPYRGKEDIAQFPIGSVFYEEGVPSSKRLSRVDESAPSLHRKAYMSTRVLAFNGLEENNYNMREREFYVHGTNRENGLGNAASGGCIRVSNADILEVFELIEDDTLIDVQPDISQPYNQNTEKVS